MQELLNVCRLPVRETIRQLSNPASGPNVHQDGRFCLSLVFCFWFLVTARGGRDEKGRGFGIGVNVGINAVSLIRGRGRAEAIAAKVGLVAKWLAMVGCQERLKV